MKRLHMFVLAASLILVSTASAQRTRTETNYQTSRILSNRALTPRQHNLYAVMRKLWEDHITWTRLYIVAAASDSPDKQATTERLLRNQSDIGNAIKPYYGDSAGNKLTDLLRDHILIAADIIEAAKNGNNRQLNNLRDRWSTNANQIADFLSAANSQNWSRSEMRAMMRAHLSATLDEATAQLQGRYADSIAAYDRVHVQILSMADELSNGIVMQFPQRFRM